MFGSWLDTFKQQAKGSSLEPHLDTLYKIAADVIANINQGDLHKWLTAFEQLPSAEPAKIDTDQGPLTLTFRESLTDKFYAELEACLMGLHPWRKGPFRVGDCLVDAEWQSHHKWSRLIEGLPDLKNKTVLDVGCGNGYYMMKMAQFEPRLLLGIEPGLLHNVQFWSIEKYAQTGACLLPLKIQHMPKQLSCFDVVFSMGVLYHRKNPINHIEHLKSLLSPNGTLILETLVIDGDEQACLVPRGRYAQMRNVWFLPSVAMLSLWLKKIGFKTTEVIDVSLTTINEQRSTKWMSFHSLQQFLSADQKTTIEGHPPPKRVIISCQK